MATVSFPYWVLQGYGWQTSYAGDGTVTITRAPRANTATVTVSVNMATGGGDTSRWEVRATCGGVSNSGTIAAAGTHSAGYSASKTITLTNVPVNEAAGSIKCTVSIGVPDYNSWSTDTATLSYSAADVPAAPTNVTATKVSDNKINIAWTNPTGYVHSANYVGRVVDGVDGGIIATLAATSTSYSDTTTSIDHAYTYYVQSGNGAGKSAKSSIASPIYTTPAAPSALVGARQSNTIALLTITNRSNVATGLDLQYSTDGETWNTAASYSGSPVTSCTYDTGGGVFYFRCRNTGHGLNSAWSPISNRVVTIVAPNPPTITSPNNVVSKSDANVVVSWLHNTIDGSPQEGAKIRYRIDGGSWSADETETTATSHNLAMSLFAVNSLVEIQVCTKGAAAEYSEWSSIKATNIYQVPTVSIVSPANGAEISTMPIAIQLQYSDQSGTLANASFKLRDANNVVLYTEDIGTSLTADISAAEFLPADLSTYTLEAAVRSSSSLTATSTVQFSTAFAEPYHGTLQITNDTDTGYVQLVAGWDETTGETAAVSVDVYRLTADGNRKALIVGGAQGAGITDKYAPLNTAYQYQVVTHSAAQALYTVVIDNQVVTPRWFCYWGDNIAYSIWSPAGNFTVSRPEKVRKHYVGRALPVSYDGSAMDETHSYTSSIIEPELLPAFRKLIQDGGRGVWKSADGVVIHADFELSVTPNYQTNALYGDISLSITRIDGEKL